MLYIGRTPDNHLCIENEKISKRHCSLEKTADGHILLKDLGSANGTFVNESQIQQTTIKMSDKICLASFHVDTSMLFYLLNQTPIPKLTYEKLLDMRSQVEDDVVKLRQYQTKFQGLEKTYLAYKETKHHLQTGTQHKALIRRGLIMGTGLLISGSLYVTALSTSYDMQKDPYMLKILMTLITAAAGVVVTFASPNMVKLNEKIEELNEKYMESFVCPKCKKFLGYASYKQIARNRTCPSCRVQLVE
jgi:hypothetical protein